MLVFGGVAKEVRIRGLCVHHKGQCADIPFDEVALSFGASKHEGYDHRLRMT